MPRYVGLLRGVNVGGKNTVPMAQLRAVVTSLGHSAVITYIQSGNLIFTSDKPVAPKSLETAIATEFGVDIVVVLRTPAELKKIVAANPFASADLSKVHVGFMSGKPPPAAVSKLEPDLFLPEEFVIKGTELYVHLPNGMGRTKLMAYLGRRLTVPTTVRNWNTVMKLVELAG
jgi:uncharacterized protein (DUF1697 family)